MKKNFTTFIIATVFLIFFLLSGCSSTTESIASENIQDTDNNIIIDTDTDIDIDSEYYILIDPNDTFIGTMPCGCDLFLMDASLEKRIDEDNIRDIGVAVDSTVIYPTDISYLDFEKSFYLCLCAQDFRYKITEFSKEYYGFHPQFSIEPNGEIYIENDYGKFQVLSNEYGYPYLELIE